MLLVVSSHISKTSPFQMEDQELLRHSDAWWLLGRGP